MSKLTACSANWLRPITCSTAKIAIIFEIARKNAECFITYILFISDMLRNENISLYLQQKT